MAIGKLKKHKSPGIDQIQGELIIACSRTVFLKSLDCLILLEISRKCMNNGRILSLYPSLRKMIKQKEGIL